MIYRVESPLHSLREAVSGAACDPASSRNVSYLLTAWMRLLTVCNIISLLITAGGGKSFDAYYVSTLLYLGVRGQLS